MWAAAAAGSLVITGKAASLTAAGQAGPESTSHNPPEEADAAAYVKGEEPPVAQQQQQQQQQQPPAACGFTFGAGKNAKTVQLSARAQARAHALFQDDATDAQAELDTTAKHNGPPLQEARPAASGFTFGAGTKNAKPVQLTAQAKARAESLFQDDAAATQADPDTTANHSRDEEACPVASGFAFGAGTKNAKPVQLTAQAKARAESLFQDDSTAADMQPQSVTAAAASHLATPSRKDSPEGKALGSDPAAPGPAASGFAWGAKGKAAQISASALAQAQSFFQDENDVPKPAGSLDREDAVPVKIQAVDAKPEGKAGALAKPVLGTPKTGPTSIKTTASKRTMGGSSSVGGTAYKKLRMSKLVTPSCLGLKLNRVKFHLGLCHPVGGGPNSCDIQLVTFHCCTSKQPSCHGLSSLVDLHLVLCLVVISCMVGCIPACLPMPHCLACTLALLMQFPASGFRLVWQGQHVVSLPQCGPLLDCMQGMRNMSPAVSECGKPPGDLHTRLVTASSTLCT